MKRRSRLQRKLQQAIGYFPQSLLARGVFDPAANVAMRRGRIGVRRPLAESALGDGIIFRVDPQNIRGRLQKHANGPDIRDWFLVPGDWDIAAGSVRTHSSFSRMAGMLTASDYHDTELYAEYCIQEAKGTLPDRVHKVIQQFGSLDAYFDRYSELAHIMRETGAVPHFGDGDKDRYVGLAIGRDGTLLHHQKGHHRIALAKLLNCRQLDAKVLVVHPTWLKEQVRRSGLSPSKAITAGVEELIQTNNGQFSRKLATN